MQVVEAQESTLVAQALEVLAAAETVALARETLKMVPTIRAAAAVDLELMVVGIPDKQVMVVQES